MNSKCTYDLGDTRDSNTKMKRCFCPHTFIHSVSKGEVCFWKLWDDYIFQIYFLGSLQIYIIKIYALKWSQIIQIGAVV